MERGQKYFDIHYCKDTNKKYAGSNLFTWRRIHIWNKNALPDEPELIHGNIANYFVNNGFIGINATIG